MATPDHVRTVETRGALESYADVWSDTWSDRWGVNTRTVRRTVPARPHVRSVT